MVCTQINLNPFTSLRRCDSRFCSLHDLDECIDLVRFNRKLHNQLNAHFYFLCDSRPLMTWSMVRNRLGHFHKPIGSSQPLPAQTISRATTEQSRCVIRFFLARQAPSPRPKENPSTMKSPQHNIPTNIITGFRSEER